MSLIIALVMLPGLIIGLTVHEFAHAWSASLLGDNFPRRQGRVSLNPFRHLSLLGTLAIFLLPFGWGKPVIVNLYNFKHPKRDYLISSLAGPLANVVVAAVCIGLMYLTIHPYRFGPHALVWISLSYHMLSLIASINIMLAVLNLIPIPPLDGSKIWPCLIPGAKPTMGNKTTLTFLIVFVILMYTHSLGGITRFAMDGVRVLFPQSDEQVFSLRQAEGKTAYGEGKYAEAQGLLSEALTINPWSDSCYYSRACAKGYQKDWAGALEDMNQAINLKADNADYREFRADVLTSLGREKDALIDRVLAGEFRKMAAGATQPSSQPTTDPSTQSTLLPAN